MPTLRHSRNTFQSRNRGSFDFKPKFKHDYPLPVTREFQSRNRGSFDFKLAEACGCHPSELLFQSRNRGSFDFKGGSQTMTYPFPYKFQSRNRGSFDFKTASSSAGYPRHQSFNLVIEVLLISSCGRFKPRAPRERSQFQSRNRGSFDFKLLSPSAQRVPLFSFNLVIEVLLISRARGQSAKTSLWRVSIS